MNEFVSQHRNAPLSQTFDPENFFVGDIKATGVFIDRFGSVRRRFNVLVTGHRTAFGFVLDENFLFDDGEQEKRRWEIKKLGQNTYVGSSDDVCGEAIGKLTNAHLSWQYHFNLKIFNRKIKVKFEDVMIQQTPFIMLNNAKVKKYGLLLGEVFITFIKTDQKSSSSPVSPVLRSVKIA